MTNATFAEGPIVAITPGMIEEIKSKAAASKMRRHRICLHQSVEDQTQEMVIACCRDSVMPPHRHPAGRSESYHVIEGAMKVLFFDDAGKIERRLEIAERGSDRPSLYRLCAPRWHTAYPVTDWLVYHEVLTGPFDPDQAVEYPGWMPKDTPSEDVAAFLARAAAAADDLPQKPGNS